MQKLVIIACKSKEEEEEEDNSPIHNIQTIKIGRNAKHENKNKR